VKYAQKKYTTKRTYKKKYTTTPAYEDEEEDVYEEDSYTPKPYKKSKQVVYQSQKSNSSYSVAEADSDDDDDSGYSGKKNATYGSPTYGSAYSPKPYNKTSYAEKQVYATTASYNNDENDDDEADAGYDSGYQAKTQAYKTTHKTTAYHHQHHHPSTTTYASVGYGENQDSYLDEAERQPNVITIHQNHTKETDLVLRLVTNKKSEQY